MIKFGVLGGDVNFREYGGSWISKKFNNGEFDYWLVIVSYNMLTATKDRLNAKYALSISVLAPSQVPGEVIKSSLMSYGLEQEKIDDMTSIDEKYLFEILVGCGVCATLYSNAGNNFWKLFRQCHEEAEKINILFGFYMDRPINRLGATGWDFIKGRVEPGEDPG